MAVATTFGTASTGTAISALTGAAAANAALAWIGGGALAAGGGGVVAGQAILALAGPVGWAIAGVSLTGGAILLAYKNKKGAEKANIETIRAEQETITLEEANNKISEMHMLTSYQTIEVSERLDKLYRKDAVNYHDFSDQEKLELGALVNSARSLATSLNIIIE